MRLSLTVVVAMLVGCGGDDAVPTDAATGAMDARTDAGETPDAGRDAGLTCSMACASGQRCCLVVGAPTCVDLTTDPDNCGACGYSCAGGRGTSCALGMCVCGFADIGCAGTRISTCCLPTTDGGMPHCGNLETSGNDCGGCGLACDPMQASQCVSGACQCGLEGRACSGAPTDVCCIDATVGDASCVDTLADRRNCGRCNERCTPAETCTGGSCTRGMACATPCGAGEVCCDGACCTRSACDRGAC